MRRPVAGNGAQERRLETNAPEIGPRPVAHITDTARRLLSALLSPRPDHGRAGTTSSTKVILVVAGLLSIVYSLTANWGPDYHIDAGTNAITAWSLANRGTVLLPDHDHLASPEHQGNIGFFVESPSGIVGQYPPGAPLAAVPFYLLSNEPMKTVNIVGTSFPERGATPVPLPPLWPATATAVATTALACALAAGAMNRIGWHSFQAVVGGLSLGLATSAWSVSSNALWTHGPAMMFVGLGVFSLSRDRLLLAGFAFGGAILVRPHLALIAAAAGLTLALTRRSWQPLWKIGLGSTAGLATLLAVNFAVWERLTISGGYGSGFTTRFATADPTWRILNVLGAFFDPMRGLLVWAPFLLVLIPAAWFARRKIPDWAIGAALGGVAYLTAQLMSNRFSGGGGFFSYRYPLETLIASAPLLFAGFVHWALPRPMAMRLLSLTVTLAVVAQATGALLT